MNNLIEKSDPRVIDLFRRLEKASGLIDKLEVPSRRSFNGQRFVTDRELSERLRVSRRTLQEYRSAGIIPYYLICGKILYKESEVQQFLEDSRRQNIEQEELL
ncbi:MAG: helix-turn-helix domain-containing protein [Massilibacteroides sp.]|nr:helix-turn-helix domain-containing protein [Massilibacteroides sp.]MDD3062936.1 helix-turn-helix domain-containing protein [Massilibacteroides sp.]MDD4116152.1 helix-turn-helix domain-containing protein [Massilibacteroides sp.]MDD4660860.1 helix-turn-helix domain-containing protein [Massilibacteroides sp.]